MRKIFLIYILLIGFYSFGKSAPISVYILSDNQSMDKNLFKEWASKISNLKISYTKCDIFQSVFETRFPDSWVFGKTNVSYAPLKIDCKYDPCKSLKTFIDEKSTDKTKLFFGGENFNCNLQSFGIESSPLKMDINMICQKINEEFQINNKTLKKNLTLIFYLAADRSFSAPKVSFAQDTIKLKKGEKTELICDIQGDYSTLNWQPRDGLSCSNCERPSMTVDKLISYSVSATNEFGCVSESATIIVEPLKACEGKIQECTILYSIDHNLYRQVLGDASKWLMASSQPGTKLYYLVCEPNCGERFELSLLDNANRKIMTETFKLSDIIKGQKLHEDYPEYFIFKVNLTKYDFDSKEFYRFEIKTKDDEGNTYPKYTSPPTKFVDCGFVE